MIFVVLSIGLKISWVVVGGRLCGRTIDYRVFFGILEFWEFLRVGVSVCVVEGRLV